MKKILIGYVTGEIGNGINTYLENIFAALEGEDVSIDVLSCSYTDALESTLEEKNMKLYKIARLTHPIKRYTQTKKILKNNSYDIVYLNISEAFNCVCNIAAKKHSNAIIITHSHSAGNDKKNPIKRKLFHFIHTVFKPILRNNTDVFFACSTIAGEWLFGNKINVENKLRIINNTIDTEKFKFNPISRSSIRNRFEMKDDDIVLGFVGNFNYQKNIMFILQLFSSLHNQHPNYRLMLVGDGELRQQMIDFIHQQNLTKYVFFTGRVSNVYDYMSSMDKFILASNFEGLGIVGIEAQVNGLPCFFSDAVPKEINISNLATFISLQEDEQTWTSTIANTLLNSERTHIKLKENIVIDKYKQYKEFKEIFLENRL